MAGMGLFNLVMIARIVAELWSMTDALLLLLMWSSLGFAVLPGGYHFQAAR